MSARVITGDCLDVLPTLDAESWDHAVPGVEFWREALRVAKPGAYLAAFGGTRTYHRLTVAIEDAGWEIHDCLSWLYGSGFPKHASKLKPGWEPIILARRPAPRATPLNIDVCRIAGPKGDGVWGTSNKTVRPDRMFNGSPEGGEYRSEAHEAGRWPANVVLDEDAAALLDEQSGTLTSGANPTRRGSNKFANTYGEFVGQEACAPARGADSGGASRFFYCAKASRAERDAGLTSEKKPLLWSAGTKSPGTFQSAGTDKSACNHHPTVKPIALMRWLCRLVTPAGGVVLDPFCGSGTTGRAAIAEGFQFVGIELSPEYAAIARARIAEYAPLFADGAA